MNHARWAWVVFLLAVGAIGLAQEDTGWLNPSADSDDFSNGLRAYYDDTKYAKAKDEQEHSYWGYAISIPDDAGFKELSPAQTIRITSGTTWSLYVAADAATWTYAGSEPPPGKPCSHLQFRVVYAETSVSWAQTSYLGMTTAPQHMATGVGGSDIRLKIGLGVVVDYETTVPGTYELGFTYTLSAP